MSGSLLPYVGAHTLTRHSWWKAKFRDQGDVEGAVGLIPASYVEEVSLPFVSLGTG